MQPSAIAELKLPYEQRIQGAVRRILNAKGQLSTSNLADALHLSERQLERLFLKYVGVQPKLFMRIARFRASLRKLSSQTSCTTLALEHGYSDQAHFTREIREFTGFTPTQLQMQNTHVGFFQADTRSSR